MLDRYEPASFEAKWRERWAESDLFRTREDDDRPKFYGLDFFPYPSGAGLSVGHCRNFIPTDVLCRMKYMQGFNVLHPMGFDAFGLPAENEAIKTKSKPGPMIERYAATYKRQMDLIGISYDWSREVNSSDPGYYRWTQWIFKLLYKRGLAYRSNAAVNWCPKDKTALANEEVVGGLCERCGTPVEKRFIPQWFFRITDYAQRLIDDLDTVDWPEGIKQMQRNWIGRSEGYEFDLKIETPGDSTATSQEELEILNLGDELTIRVFTTRIDTIFGVSYCVVAPEHPILQTILPRLTPEKRKAVEEYQQRASRLSDMDRQATTKEKTGVDTGATAINPATGESVPLYVADYVLMNYGTGAIMAVPAHDERDFEFARAFGLPIPAVIVSSPEQTEVELPFVTKDGFLVNSGEYSGMSVTEAQKNLGEWLTALGIGTKKINYKLRDWLISRQRYWGCPIPVTYDKAGDEELVPDSALPVELPDIDHYEPTGDGQSPLAMIDEFVRTTTSDGSLGRRETDTMGGFACSSWYFLRFCDPHNEEQPWDKAKADYWMPVDCYVGGAEHAVMHLLYARFWTKVLYDEGLVSVQEPFQRLMNQGMLLAQTPYRAPREDETLRVGEEGIQISFEEAENLGPDNYFLRWEKMSKSKGNVVTPDQAVEQFGADALRIYELFVAPFEQTVQWTEEGVQGAVRFLSRCFKLAHQLQPLYISGWKIEIDTVEATAISRQLRRATHQVIKRASEDISAFAFNTYIASCMTFVNTINDLLKAGDSGDHATRLALSEAIESLVLVLSPAAPHSCDEIWTALGGDGFVYQQDWPYANELLAKEDHLNIAVQVNGKLRDTFMIAADSPNELLEKTALDLERVKAFTDGKQIRKVIVVPGKLVNIVAN